MHLNSLSGMLGSHMLDNMHVNCNGMLPEIIFHSRHCPIPMHNSGAMYFDHEHAAVRPMQHINYFDKEEHNDDNHAHNHHEKAFCRIYNWHGQQIPFNSKWRDHPCYLVIPKMPESVASSSANNSVHECEHVSADRSNFCWLCCRCI